jgi:hypothetical protein
MSATGCSLHLSRRPPSSDLPRATDILGVRRHVSKGRIPDITRLSDQVVNDPDCVKSRAWKKCREHNSSKLDFRMHEEHAVPTWDDS